jgi:hypothetical protein
MEVIKMHRRIKETVRLIDSVSDKNDLRKRLQEGALRRAKRDLRLTEEWFFLEEEWPQRRKVPPTLV